MILNFDNPELKETRLGFADALIELGEENPDVVVLTADVSKSVKTDLFSKKFPERFFNVGISEQDLIGIAAGFSVAGKIPFVSTYGEFATGRPYDQIRQSVAYSKMNVKICASHCGISVGQDGATHQSLEDISLMRTLPNMIVISPCDYNQTFLSVKKSIEYNAPFYIRFYRDRTPVFTSNSDLFEIGKSMVLQEGNDLTIIATGLLVWEALKASKSLGKKGIFARVLNMHTIKPIDKEAIIKSAKETGYIITCEDHQKSGGLFSAVTEVTAENYPIKVDYIAIEDTFGESGKMFELMKKYKIDSFAIENKILKSLKLKNK
jgi:transketolase